MEAEEVVEAEVGAEEKLPERMITHGMRQTTRATTRAIPPPI